MTTNRTDIAIVGCGYAADFYLINLPNHPSMRVVGVYDRNTARSRAFAATWGLKVFSTLDALLGQSGASIVLNLTNPTSHFEVTAACLAVGRHVYSEKPLAMTLEDGRRLVALAATHRLRLAVGPCNVLGEAFQTALSLERDGVIGQSRLATARLHEGAIHLMRHDLWVSRSGAAWPTEDEFAIGCVLEHAGYLLSLLVALWGPMRTVHATTAMVFPDKGIATSLAPDWTTAVIGFDEGRFADVSLSIVMPPDRSLSILGTHGVITVDDVWRFESPVRLMPMQSAPAENPHGYLSPAISVPLLTGPQRNHRYADTHDLDQLRGVADLVEAIVNGTEPRLGAEHALHLLEAKLAMAEPDDSGGTRMTTTPPVFIRPEWARVHS